LLYLTGFFLLALGFLRLNHGAAPLEGVDEQAELSSGIAAEFFDVEHFNASLPSNLDLPWRQLSWQIRKSPRSKLLVLMRHGQAEHNLGPSKFGRSRWFAVEGKSDAYFDAPLTDLGSEQAKNASRRIERAQFEGLKLDKILVSPLTRTIQTALLAIHSSKTSLSSHSMCAPLAVELCRERYGVYPCDKRHDRSFLQTTYPDMDFSEVADDMDMLWSAESRETDEQMQKRAAAFLDWVWTHVNEKHILISTHSDFIKAIYGSLGLSGVPPPENAELIPLALSQKTR
jgi:broad specificity phosphatase PhoE